MPSFQNLKRDIRPDVFINESVTATLWVGANRAQSPAHHDLAYNLYIQVLGVKTFRLFPHDSVLSLCVHGRYHPHARQSRYIDIETLEIINTSSASAGNRNMKINHSDRVVTIRHMCDAASAQGFNVTLYPGSVLFIPPFWYHEVNSVIIN